MEWLKSRQESDYLRLSDNRRGRGSISNCIRWIHIKTTSGTGTTFAEDRIGKTIADEGYQDKAGIWGVDIVMTKNLWLKSL